MSAGSGSEPEVVYSHDINMTSIRRTGNPDVVVLGTRLDHGSDATPTAVDRDANISINHSDGTAQEFRGMGMSSIWTAMYSQQELAPAPVVLMYDWAGTGPGTVEVRAIDPTSGEIIHSFEAANPNDLTVGAASGKNQMGVSEDGMVLVIGNGQQLIVINGKGETPSVSTLPMDTAMGMAQGTITVSADGNLVGLSTQSESRDRFLIDFSTPEPTVTKIETEGFSPVSHITFVDPMD